MEHFSSAIFQALFQTQNPKIILHSTPDFQIVDYNTAFKILFDNTYIYKGQPFFEFCDAFEGFDSNLILKCFSKAKDTEAAVVLPIVKDLKSWQFEVVSVQGEQNNYGYFILSANDISALMIANYREQELGEELSSSHEELNATLEELSTTNLRLQEANTSLEAKVNDRMRQLANTEGSLRSLVMNAHYPLMILRGRDWVIEIANQPLVDLWDKTIEGVTGERLMTILPEIEDQPFPGFLRQVYDSGVGYGQEEQIFFYNSPSGPAEKYVSFYYDPMRDDTGEVCGVIVSADDITSKVLQRKEVENMNNMLAATVEELTASNEELEQSRQELLEKHLQLTETEQRFRQLIRQAPVGICVIRSSDLAIEHVNDSYLELVGKTREELESRTIWAAVPESSEYYGPILNSVIQTTTPFVGKEHELTLIRQGVAENVFIDFVYEPVLIDGIVISIMVVAIDVTEKVNARKAVEEVEKRMRLALEAAEIGTFEFSYLDNSIVTSTRFDAIFGISNPKTRQELLTAFHPEDVQLSTQAHLHARSTGNMFYESRLVHQDGSLHWIRVQAKVFYTGDGKSEKLLGTILDITDFKRLQQQKDDFISIASHELKTPITSLKASLQLLQRQKDKGNFELLSRLIDQAGRSMDKISGLVEDLLNVSRLNTGTIQIKKSHFLFKTLIEDCCQNVQDTGSHEIVLEGDLSLQVFADENRIEQVLNNFITNAMKYAPNSPAITISVKQQGNVFTVSVKDEGPGIPTDQIPHLFDRYFRADESGKQVSGLGLGLYISAEIVERHGGTIGVESEIGKGSTFWFSLPVVIDSEIQL